MMIHKKSTILLLCLLVLMIASIFIGRYPIFQIFSITSENKLFLPLIIQVRIPRILAAVLVGASLAISGLVMQTIFKNPLADPGILGVSQASGFGAALGIMIGQGSILWTQILSFMCAVSALALALLISKKIYGKSVLSLILAGIAVSALFSAGVGIIKYIADPIDQLPSIVYWLLGSLSSTNWHTLIRTIIIVGPLILFFWFYRWRLNIHAFDREVAFSLGLKNNKELNFVLVCSVLLTSTIISISGVVGWVGLIIPNLVRLTVSADTQKSMPVVMVLGGIYVLICDNLARALLPGEIPLGIFTAFFGSILFIYLLHNKQRFL